MDWTAVGAIAAVLSLPLAYHLGTRRKRARIYAEPCRGRFCRVVIQNNSETPVAVSKVRATWPLSLKIGVASYGTAPNEWTDRPKLETTWSRTISVAEIVAPGKTGYLDFELRSRNRSSVISLIVDESRPTQINKIRLIKVLQIPATDNQRPSIFVVG